MSNRVRSSAFVLEFGLTLILLAGFASAEELGVNKNLVCAATNVTSCENGPGCVEGSARDFDLAEFLFIDFDKNLVRAKDEIGDKAVSLIKTQDMTTKQIILQGVENHRGWNVTIDRRNGRMALTSSGSGVSFMIFGACTSL